MPGLWFDEPQPVRIGVRDLIGSPRKAPEKKTEPLPEAMTDDELTVHAVISRQFTDNGHLPVSTIEILGRLNDGRPEEKCWLRERFDQALKMLLKRRVVKECGYQTYAV